MIAAISISSGIASVFKASTCSTAPLCSRSAAWVSSGGARRRRTQRTQATVLDRYPPRITQVSTGRTRARDNTDNRQQAENSPRKLQFRWCNWRLPRILPVFRFYPKSRWNIQILPHVSQGKTRTIQAPKKKPWGRIHWGRITPTLHSVHNVDNVGARNLTFCLHI